MAIVSEGSTAPYDGYAVLFSSFPTAQLALVGGTNYGIAGSGGLIVFHHSVDNKGGISVKEIKRYQWKDVLYDVTWSELNESVCVCGSGDGTIILFDFMYQEPVLLMRGHTGEVSSVEWSLSRKEQHIISSSWDTTIKLWDPNTGTGLMTLTGHTGIVYCTKWSPHLSSTVASVSGDGTLKLWDLSSSSNTATINEGGHEILSCSWNKYDENILCTGGTDHTIKLWDIRQLSLPFNVMRGHTQTIRQVKFDPHSPSLVGSSSYDFTVRLWDTSNYHQPLLQTISHHTEFTYSMDFCVHQKGLVVDCSWDKTVKVYTASSLLPPATLVT